MSARLASQSTILPLPSSPHWAPMTVTFANGFPFFVRRRRSRGPRGMRPVRAAVGTGGSSVRCGRMKPMTEEHLALFRRHMAEIIDMHFDLAGDEIGKDAPDPQLRRALIDVPRHLFVPQALMLASYQDTPLP